MPATPAFVFEEAPLRRTLDLLAHARAACGIKVLYSIKALPLHAVLELVKPHVDGFSVSSEFEARLAGEALRGGGTVHITTPGLKPDDLDAIASLCDFVNFNSLGQYRRLSPHLPQKARLGLRVNPGRSYLHDHRYDPCRPHSKLGVALDEARAFLSGASPEARRIKGIGFHTLFSSRTFEPLAETLALIERTFGDTLSRLRWINIGGGYLVESEREAAVLSNVVGAFRDRWDLDVYFEPGKGLVNASGCLVASVIDLFQSGGKTVAVLDTSVNHHPEVFEYQSRPALEDEQPMAPHRALLAGCTCLSGDVFGEYAFAAPLSLGDRVVFRNVGAYSLVKAHRFNGYRLPDVYTRGEDGTLRLIKRDAYADYRRQWGPLGA